MHSGYKDYKKLKINQLKITEEKFEELRFFLKVLVARYFHFISTYEKVFNAYEKFPILVLLTKVKEGSTSRLLSLERKMCILGMKAIRPN